MTKQAYEKVASAYDGGWWNYVQIEVLHILQTNFDCQIGLKNYRLMMQLWQKLLLISN